MILGGEQGANSFFKEKNRYIKRDNLNNWMVSEAKRVQEAKERYILILRLLTQNNDQTGVSLLNELVDACRRYVKHLVESEIEYNRLTRGINTAVDKEIMDIVEYQSKLRVQYHNAIIRDLEIMNRYLFSKYKEKIPIGGLYSLDPRGIENRSNIALWAELFLKAITKK